MGKFPAIFFKSAGTFFKKLNRRENFQTFLNRRENFGAKKITKFESLTRSAWVKWCTTGKWESSHTSNGSHDFQTNTHPWHYK
jgi:hypothetical protein